MRRPLIEYVLLALLSGFAVGIMAYALWPVVGLTLDGLNVVSAALAGGK